jgi:FkbM family methyltransferase
VTFRADLRTRFRRALRNGRLPARPAAQLLLEALGNATPSVFFVEIGANDGTALDHLRPFILSDGWRGIMVEPVPYVFERLTRNYGRSDAITLENVAISDRDGTRPFYYVANAGVHERERLPYWYDQIGSFSREVIESHADEIVGLSARIRESDVECMTFESLCRRHAVVEVDVLLIDTEGHDYDILKTIDFSVRRPRVVAYEHYHLKPHDRHACSRLLQAAGYLTLEEGFDTWCLRSDQNEGIVRMWGNLRPAIPGASVYDPPQEE